MIDKKTIKKNLITALDHDHDNDPKKRKEQYPGYWLMIARDVLETNAYEHLIRKLGMSHFDVRNHRMLFMIDVYYIHTKESHEQEQQP